MASGVLDLGVAPIPAPPEQIVKVSGGRLIRRVALRSGQINDTDAGRIKRHQDPRATADLNFLQLKAPPSVNPAAPTIRVADLFSGCGAMSLGLAEACRAIGKGVAPAFVSDINRVALDVYEDNFGTQVPETVDLGKLSSLVGSARNSFEVKLQRTVHAIDFAVAGPPCQGHSNLNNHTRRNDPKNGLYLRVARFAELFSPKYIVVENVPAVVRDKQGVVPRTTQHLVSLGYRVIQGIVDLSRLGVAQTRRRHIVIAALRDANFVARTPAELVAPFEVPLRPVNWAIGDLVDDVCDSDPMLSVPQMSPETRRRIKWLFTHKRFDLDDHERPDCHRKKKHTYQAVYGRMRPELPAPTITGGFSTMGQGRFVHPSRERTLTPREAARLQFLPDFFRFDRAPNRKALTELIGNAVPPKLSYVIGLELLR